MRDRVYDVAIIGAGINGAGIARDAALRGLKVVVLEKSDFCGATSAASSRLIHGGLRYLEYGEIPLVFESLRERTTLCKIAAHLVRPLRITIPIYRSARRGPLLIRLGMLAYDLLSLGKTLPRHDMLDQQGILEAEPGLLRDGLLGAARYFDAQVTFAERLVMENLLAARSAGATVLNYHAVEKINIEDGRVTSLDCVDTLTQEKVRMAARIIVNAAGPWIDAVLHTAADDPPQLIGGTKGSHIIVGCFDGAPRDAFYVEAAADGRPFFIIPWHGQYLIGTTDIRYDGGLDEVRASREEVDYLLGETNRVFPSAGLGIRDIHYAYAGVRPLPRRDQGPESSITRRHIIRRNRKVARGLVSIIGGKLTTYRNLAEQTVDRVGRMLGRRLPQCRTRDTLLPGAYRLAEARTTLGDLQSLSDAGIDRLLAIYGGHAIAVARLADEDGTLNRCLDPARTILAAETVFAIRHEMARTLADIVYRRMMLGLGADQGRPYYSSIAALAAAELGWNANRRDAETGALLAYSDSFKV